MRISTALLIVLLVITAACAVPASGPGLRVITEDFPTYNFVDRNGNVAGRSVEIVRAILQQQGLAADVEVLPLSQGMEIARKGPGVVIFSINRTPQREGLYKWIGPIGEYEQVFYALRISSWQVKTLEDAKAVAKIGVYKGDAGNQFLASSGFNNLDESQTDAGALKKLADGSVQLWLGNREGLAVTAREAGISPDMLVEFPVIVTKADLYIAVSRDVPDSTVAAWQKALDTLKQVKDAGGQTAYERIQARYDDIRYVQGLLK